MTTLISAEGSGIRTHADFVERITPVFYWSILPVLTAIVHELELTCVKFFLISDVDIRMPTHKEPATSLRVNGADVST